MSFGQEGTRMKDMTQEREPAGGVGTRPEGEKQDPGRALPAFLKDGVCEGTVGEGAVCEGAVGKGAVGKEDGCREAGCMEASAGSWIETVERFARQSSIVVLVAGLGTGRTGPHCPMMGADGREKDKWGQYDNEGRDAGALHVPHIWCVHRELRHGRIMAFALVLTSRVDAPVWQPCFQHDGPFVRDIPRGLFELLTPPSAWSADVREEEPEAVFWYERVQDEMSAIVQTGGPEGAGRKAKERANGRAFGSPDASLEEALAGTQPVSAFDRAPDRVPDSMHGGSSLAVRQLRAEHVRRRLGAGRALGNRAVKDCSRKMCENIHVLVPPLV